MDIERTEAQLAAEDDGITVEIVGPTGEPEFIGETEIPVTITVAGTHSKRYRAALEWQRKQVQAKGRKKITEAEQHLMVSGVTARCTIGWPEGAFLLGGKPLPFSIENATTLYDRLPLVQAQVEAGMNDHAGFTPKTSNAS